MTTTGAQMPCPFCDFADSPRRLHAHMAESHTDQVTVEERETSRIYGISCPTCGATHEQPIKPRLRDSGFLEEFAHEIRLVAFDMLINHMIAEHGETEVALPGVRSPGGNND